MKNTLHFTFFRTLLVVAFGLFFNGAWGQYSGNGNFKKITLLSDLTDGYYVIGNASESVAMSNNHNGTFFAQTSISPVQNQNEISNPSANIVWKIETNGSGKTIYNEATNKYASFQGSSNNIQVVESVGADNQRWNFTYNGGEFSANNVGVTARFLKYNSSATRFACYTSGQQNLALYKLQQSTEPTIVTSVSSLAFQSTFVGENSSASIVNFSGSNLNTDVIISVPANFEISSNANSWTQTLVVSPVSGNIASTDLYVRFSPVATGDYTGNITFSGGGLNPAIEVSVSGTSTIHSPVATSATNILGDNFIANWSTVSGALSYRLDVSTNSNFSTSGLGFTEGFESPAFPPSGWLGDNWTRSTTSGDVKSGFGAAIADSNNGSLTTKAVSYPSTLSFYLGRSSNSTAKTLNIEVSTTSQTSGFVTVMSFTHSEVPSSSYNQYTVDLSAYNNQPNVYIRFVKSSSTASPWRLDDVVVTPYSNPSFVAGYNNLLVAGNSHLVEGLTQGTEYFYRVRAENNNSTSLNSNIIPVTTASTSTIWNGLVWSNGAPTSSLDAIINGNYNTTAGTIVANSLTVNSGTFTVASGTSVTVQNVITNSGLASNFIVENDANLIQVNDVLNTGAVTVLRNSAPIVRLDHTLWASPVTGSQTLQQFSPNTLANRFYELNTATNAFVSVAPSTVFAEGKGFGIRADNGWNATQASAWPGIFTGTLNNGEATIPVVAAGLGYNLVGNPYPSAIDAVAFVEANSAVVENKLYFYEHSVKMQEDGTFNGNNYGVATVTNGDFDFVPADNGTATSSEYIATGQGFLVKALPSANGNIVFNNTMRSAETPNFHRASAADFEKHSIRLNLSNNNGLSSSLLVKYATGATQEVDESDAGAYGIPTFYSLIETEKFKIQGRSLPFTDQDIVPLGFKAFAAGNHTITLGENTGLFTNQDIFLKDNATGTIHDLKSGAYSFVSESGSFDSRFDLVYTTSALGIENPSEGSSIVVFQEKGQLTVYSTLNDINAITIYDISGRKLYEKNNLATTNYNITDFTSLNQVLILKIDSKDQGTLTKKILF